jgi:hypothetical protein
MEPSIAHRLRLLLVLVAVCLLTGAFALGCGNGDEDKPVPASPTAAPSAIPLAVCLQNANFVADGPIAVASMAGNAGSIADLRWAQHDGCERFVIDLIAEDGSPATGIGTVRAEFLRGKGIVRLVMPDAVKFTGKTRADMNEARGPVMVDLAGKLADKVYVVRTDGNRLYVDVHLAAPAEAAVTTLGGPARVVLDLRPGGGMMGRANTGRGVVVLTPGAGEARYPLTVRGYARHFEANVVAEIRQGGVAAITVSGIARDWILAYGEFELTIPDGPRGNVDLFVGDYSAADGSEQGVMIPLQLR